MHIQVTLNDLIQELTNVTNLLNEKIDLYSKSDRVYQEKYYNLYLHSPRGNDKAREAEAKAILMEEGIYEPWANLKVDLKVLQNKKDLLLEVLKNLRLTISLETKV